MPGRGRRITAAQHRSNAPQRYHWPPPDDLDELPDERRIFGAYAFASVYDADPSEWPELRAITWAAYEATRAVMDELEERVDDWLAVRANMHVAEVTPPVRTRFEWQGIRLDDEVVVVLRYRMVCNEDHDGHVTVEAPVTPFDELIAATPRAVDVAITMETIEVETTASVILDWRYRYREPLHTHSE